MNKLTSLFVVLLAAIVLGACASGVGSAKQRQVASVLNYLFPGTEQTPVVADKVAELKVPFRLGIAFVPDTTDPQFRLPENERQRLGGDVRNAFVRYPFIRDIVVVPSVYLEPGGGFANLEKAAALLNFDVVALVSFDQVQHAGASGWSFLYWTGLGAYVVEGDQYDILTAVETAVIDIKSRRMLMRAGGISKTKGTATMVGFEERAREARTKGFNEAMKDMTEKLQGEVKAFRERAPKDPNIKMILPPGYNPTADPTTTRPLSQ